MKVDEELRSFLTESATKAGIEIIWFMNKFLEFSTAHLSLSNSACYENPRSRGGRSRYVHDQISTWLDEAPDKDEYAVLPTGQWYFVAMGTPRRQLMSQGIDSYEEDRRWTDEEFNDSELF